MYLWFRMAAVIASALAIASGGDQGASPKTISPTVVVDGPTIATRTVSPFSSTPQSGGGTHAAPTRLYTLVPNPATQLPIGTPTATAPPEPTATRATPTEPPTSTQELTDTHAPTMAQPDPTEVPSDLPPAPRLTWSNRWPAASDWPSEIAV